MLKLIIVDDESLFREALRKTIPWKELGYEVCCEAENGIDALEKIAEFKPDVALVDINMPLMDGLELAAEIKESEMDTRVIIITGYGEFNYARKAIEVGVENYLLKPIDEEQLAKVLSSVKKKIDIKFDELKNQVTVYKPILKEILLGNLLYGTRMFEKEELINLKNSLKVNLDIQSYQVVVIELSETQNWDEDDRQLWIFAILNIISEIFNELCVFESCQDINGRICLVAHAKVIDTNWPQSISSLCERIHLLIEKYLKFKTTIGISNSYKGSTYISKAYNEALYAINNKLIIGENCVIQYGNIIGQVETAVNIYPIEQRQVLLTAARMGEFHKVEDTIYSIFEEMSASNIPRDLVILKCMEVVSTCIEFMGGISNEIKTILGDNFDLLEEIKNKKNLEQMKAWLKEIFFSGMNLKNARVSNFISKTVEDAKKYIDENIGRYDLKIDEIARNVYVGYGYLCTIFKKEMGKTINTYISDTRIIKAKQLIDEGCHSVYAASAKVGYADANYFGKCFKKLYGITPGKYIDNILSK